MISSYSANCCWSFSISSLIVTWQFSFSNDHDDGNLTTTTACHPISIQIWDLLPPCSTTHMSTVNFLISFSVSLSSMKPFQKTMPTICNHLLCLFLYGNGGGCSSPSPLLSSPTPLPVMVAIAAAFVLNDCIWRGSKTLWCFVKVTFWNWCCCCWW